MLDDKLKNELIEAGKKAALAALPASIDTKNGFTVPIAPIADAVLDVAVVGLEALLHELELRRVDVVGDADTEVVVKIRD